MEKNLCLFENNKFKKLLPLVYYRPVFELKCGIFSLLEKVKKYYPEAQIHLQCREYLTPVLKQSFKAASYNDISALKAGGLFINGKVLVDEEFVKNVPLEGKEEVGVCKEEVVYLRLSEKGIKKFESKWSYPLNEEVIEEIKKNLPVKEIAVNLINYLWDTIKYNNEEIKKDFNLVEPKETSGFVDPRVVVYGERKNLVVGEGTRVEAGTVINVEGGPVVIGKNVLVRPPSVIDGPCFIGDKTIIDGAKLREGNSIGPVCRIAGELEESIIQGYSNKHHDGFLGHAYLGKWVNLGAMTTNSDLKNNYGEIKVYVEGELVNSGEIKLGCFIADHTKTGIGTLINTGSCFGVGSNLFGGGVMPKFVSSFLWGDGRNFVEHDLEKMIANARKIMARRKVELSEEEANLIREIFKLTEAERKKMIKN